MPETPDLSADSLLLRAKQLSESHAFSPLGDQMALFRETAQWLIQTRSDRENFHTNDTKNLSKLPPEERTVDKKDLDALPEKTRAEFIALYQPIIQETAPSLADLIGKLVDEYGSQDKLAKAAKTNNTEITKLLIGRQLPNRRRFEQILHSLYIHNDQPYLDAWQRLSDKLKVNGHSHSA